MLKEFYLQIVPNHIDKSVFCLSNYMGFLRIVLLIMPHRYKKEASFLGTTRIFGWLSLMIGTVTYNLFKIDEVLAYSHVYSSWPGPSDYSRYGFGFSS